MEYITVQHNSLTKETVERNSTPDEIKEIERLQTEMEARKQAEQARAQAKVLAQSKLAALGLTVEDLQALGLQHNLRGLCFQSKLELIHPNTKSPQWVQVLGVANQSSHLMTKMDMVEVQ